MCSQRFSNTYSYFVIRANASHKIVMPRPDLRLNFLEASLFLMAPQKHPPVPLVAWTCVSSTGAQSGTRCRRSSGEKPLGLYLP